MQNNSKACPIIRHMHSRKTRILWSGITGRTGVEAVAITQEDEATEIVAGVCRSKSAEHYNYDQLDAIKEDFDVIVDFSHTDSFNQVLNLALECKKPLIIGTAGLSEQQERRIEEASHIIPVFKGGNFRFEVKKFIDAVVRYARVSDEDLLLVETHYKTKKIPSETAKVIAKRVLDETGKKLQIQSFLKYDELINDWRLGKLHCRVHGFRQLAEDVLDIARLMVDKRADGVYDLDRLWSQIEDRSSNFIKQQNGSTQAGIIET